MRTSTWMMMLLLPHNCLAGLPEFVNKFETPARIN